MRTRVRTRVHACLCMCACMCTSGYACAYVRVHPCMRACVRVLVQVSVCMPLAHVPVEFVVPSRKGNNKGERSNPLLCRMLPDTRSGGAQENAEEAPAWHAALRPTYPNPVRPPYTLAHVAAADRQAHTSAETGLDCESVRKSCDRSSIEHRPTPHHPAACSGRRAARIFVAGGAAGGWELRCGCGRESGTHNWECLGRSTRTCHVETEPCGWVGTPSRGVCCLPLSVLTRTDQLANICIEEGNSVAFTSAHRFGRATAVGRAATAGSGHRRFRQLHY